MDAQQQKFQALKKKLDQLQYHQPVTIESVALVDRLVNDLIRTAEGFTLRGKQNQQLQQKVDELSKQMEPFKRQVELLKKENDSITHNFICEKENMNLNNAKLETQIKILSQNDSNGKNDSKDLEIQNKLLIEQIKHFEIKIANRDKEIQRLSKRIEGQGMDDQKAIQEVAENYAISEAQNKIQQLSNQISQQNDQIQSYQSEITTLKKEQEKLNEMRKQIELYQSNQEQLKVTMNTCQEEQQAKLISYQNQISHLKNQLKNTKEEIEFEKEEVNSQRKANDSLKFEMNKLQQEINQSKEQKQIGNQTVSAYQSDKQAFQLTITQLQKDKNELLNKLKEQEKIQNTQKDNASSLEQEIVMLKSKLIQGKRDVDLTDQNYQNLMKEIKNLQNEIIQGKQQNGQLQEEIIKLNSYNGEIKLDYEKAITSKQHAEQLLEKFKQDNYKVQAQNSSQEMTKIRYQTLYEGCIQDNEFLKKEIKSIQALLQQKVELYTEEQTKSLNYFTQIKIIQDQIQSVTKEHQITVEELAKSKTQLRSLEKNNLDIRAELDKSRNLQLDQNGGGINNKRLLEMIHNLEEEKIKINKKLLESQLSEQEYKETSVDLKYKLDQAIAQKDQLCNKLNEANDQTSSLSHDIKMAKEKDYELKALHQQLQSFKEKEQKYIQQIEQINLEQSRLQNIIQNGNRQLEMQSKQKDELMGQIKELHQELTQLKEQNFQTQTQHFHTHEKYQSQNVQIQEFRDQLDKEYKKQQHLMNELQQCQNDLVLSKSDCLNNSEQIKQLKTLVESLERTREELLFKLQQRLQEKKGEEDLHLHQQNEMQRVQNEVEMLKQEVQSTREALIKVDKDRDYMQDLLDNKTEENEKINQRLIKQNAEYESIRNKNLETQNVNDNLQKNIQYLQQQLQESQYELQQCVQNNEQQKYQISLKEKEFGDISQDFSLIMKENQDHIMQIQQAHHQTNQLKQELAQFRQEKVQLIQNLKGTELERDDIIAQYKQVCQEIQRLKNNNMELQQQNQQVIQINKDGGMENEYLRRKLQEFENKNISTIQEIGSYERQMNLLSSKLEEAQQQCKTACMEKMDLQYRIENFSKYQGDIECSREEQQRILVTKENQILNLQQSVRDLTSQRESQLVQIQQKQLEISHLEKVLQKGREVQLNQQKQLEMVQFQNSQLQSNLQMFQTTNSAQQAPSEFSQQLFNPPISQRNFFGSNQNSVNKSNEYYFKEDDIITGNTSLHHNNYTNSMHMNQQEDFHSIQNEMINGEGESIGLSIKNDDGGISSDQLQHQLLNIRKEYYENQKLFAKKN